MEYPYDNEELDEESESIDYDEDDMGE